MVHSELDLVGNVLNFFLSEHSSHYHYLSMHLIKLMLAHFLR